MIIGDDLAYTDIGDMTVRNRLSSGSILPRRIQHGSAQVNEVQQVRISTTANGTFTLALDEDGSTYTTAALDFDADNATVQAALNTALSGLDASGPVTVSGGTAGIWDVDFGGVFTARDVSLMAINVQPVPNNPSASSASGT